MKRIMVLGLVLILAMTAIPTMPARAATCTATGFFRDGIDMTAAVNNPSSTVSGDVDATGCNIGVYFGPGSTGAVSGANIHGANYFGVAVQQASVNVSGSSVHDIGESPLNGTQHGIAIYYATVDNGSASAQPVCATGTTTGTVNGNTVWNYQKGGIVVNCTGAAVNVSNNTVTGQGPINYIAQNGVQISRGATATVNGNTVSGNNYTPAGTESCGLLFFLAGGVRQFGNTLFDNEKNVCNAGRGGGQYNP